MDKNLNKIDLVKSNTKRASKVREKKELSRTTRYMLIAAGYINFVLGAIAVFVPLLPSTPFLLLTVICFGKGSPRLHKWFLSTKLYKNNLEGFVNKRAMTVKSKVSVIASLTAFMAFGFIMMRNVPIGQVILAIVWVGHVLYFVFKIKTDSTEENKKDKNEN